MWGKLSCWEKQAAGVEEREEREKNVQKGKAEEREEKRGTRKETLQRHRVCVCVCGHVKREVIKHAKLLGT